jgi:hypothetical protein
MSTIKQYNNFIIKSINDRFKTLDKYFIPHLRNIIQEYISICDECEINELIIRNYIRNKKIIHAKFYTNYIYTKNCYYYMIIRELPDSNLLIVSFCETPYGDRGVVYDEYKEYISYKLLSQNITHGDVKYLLTNDEVNDNKLDDVYHKKKCHDKNKSNIISTKSQSNYYKLLSIIKTKIRLE